MNFQWRKYQDGDAKFVDSWLDRKAIKSTGLDDGWEVFYNYWTKENTEEKVASHCYIISNDNKPFAVVFLVVIDKLLIVSQLIISPKMRGKGYGTQIIKKLLNDSIKILNTEIITVQAVIFPSNKASQKVFEKSGFTVESVHDDGDALNYEYKIR